MLCMSAYRPLEEVCDSLQESECVKVPCAACKLHCRRKAPFYPHGEDEEPDLLSAN